MNEKRRARRLRVFNAIRKTPPEPLAPPDAHDQAEVAAMLRAIAEAIDRPLLANMVNGGRTPLLPASDLKALGYRIAIYPALGFLAHGHAVRHAYQDLLDHGITSDAVPLYPFKDFNSLLGFEDVWAFEKRFAETGD